MDVRKFFDHIDHAILKMLIRRVIGDDKMLKIIDIIIDSFQMDGKKIGLPLRNLTSQLFSNIYLHELDVFIKHTLRKKFYLRYCDDFSIVSHDLSELKELIPLVVSFLNDSLRLTLHPQKIILRKLSQGIDFLGYIHFVHNKLMRVSTKRRMLRRLNQAQGFFFADKITPTSMDQRLQSYLGLLSHANQHTLSQALKNAF
jgi:retron-type reverse transcriptase